MTRYPFFLVIDDGAFPHVDQTSGPAITMDFYCNVLRLAKRYGMRIPICCTMKHLDIHGIYSERSNILTYSKQLVSLFLENPRFIEFGHHGLTHEYDGNP